MMVNGEMGLHTAMVNACMRTSQCMLDLGHTGKDRVQDVTSIQMERPTKVNGVET